MNRSVAVAAAGVLLGACWGLLATDVVRAEPAATARPDPREEAAAHYKSGLSLFEAGNRDQALVEFELANEESPSWDAVFMMAQCEYHLGQLKDARAHYQAYIEHEPKGILASTALRRIEAIDRRPSVIAINSVPVGVNVQGPISNELPPRSR